jgi:hypothetical protein
MRETVELPVLRVNKNRFPLLAAAILCLAASLAATGCRIKRTIKTAILPPAKTASFDELLSIINSYDKIVDLSCSNMKLTLTYGKRESGILKEYRTAPGYILLKRPDSTHLSLQNPITKTTILDLLSIGDELKAWIPSENKFYMGKNSSKELVAEDSTGSPGITMRATHIFEAIIPQSIQIDPSGDLVSVDDVADESRQYYILSVHKFEALPRIRTVRKIWFERVGLTIARQQVFGEKGRIASDIRYSNMTQKEGWCLPLVIHMDRPLDGYALNLEFTGWQVNNSLPDSAFVLTPPEKAQIIPLREKTRSDAS